MLTFCCCCKNRTVTFTETSSANQPKGRSRMLLKYLLCCWRSTLRPPPARLHVTRLHQAPVRTASSDSLEVEPPRSPPPDTLADTMSISGLSARSCDSRLTDRDSLTDSVVIRPSSQHRTSFAHSRWNTVHPENTQDTVLHHAARRLVTVAMAAALVDYTQGMVETPEGHGPAPHVSKT